MRLPRVLADPDVHCVFVATRHRLHADIAIGAIVAGKAVFIEKPLALSWDEQETVMRAHQQHSARLMVGFNRRFAPLINEIVRFYADRTEPLTMVYRVNAGFLPEDHWYHDPSQGGGRILGEACHFVDLLAYLAGAQVQSVFANAMVNAQRYHDDNVIISLSFADGSVGTVIYTANSDSHLPKERLEVMGQGSEAVLDDFRSLELYRNGKRQTLRNRKQDKGHREEVNLFIQAVRSGGLMPISFEACLHSTGATLAAVDSLRLRLPLVPGAARWHVRQSVRENPLVAVAASDGD